MGNVKIEGFESYNCADSEPGIMKQSGHLFITSLSLYYLCTVILQALHQNINKFALFLESVSFKNGFMSSVCVRRHVGNLSSLLVSLSEGGVVPHCSKLLLFNYRAGR